MKLDEAHLEDFLDEPLDDVLRSIAGWTTVNERKFSRWYARTLYRGIGAIVDLGSLYGGIAASLAQGMGENPRSAGRQVHAYDLFLHPPFAERVHPEAREGESSLTFFLESVRPWRERIQVHEGDVAELGWSGDAIEYLFVDVMKDLSIGRSVARDFFPCLLPGQSLLVHQDFKHFHTHWIHVMMYRLRGSFEPALDIPCSGSVVYRSVDAVTRQQCEQACDYGTLSLEELDAAFELSERIAAQDTRAWRLSAAKVAALLMLHDRPPGRVDPERALAAGLKEFERLCQDFTVEKPDREFEDFLARVRRVVTPVTKHVPQHQDRDASRDLLEQWRQIAHEKQALRTQLAGGTDVTVLATSDWSLVASGEARAELQHPGQMGQSVRVAIESVPGDHAWQVQLIHERPLASDIRYAMRFRARSDAPRSIFVAVGTSTTPRTNLGLYKELTLTSDWQTFDVSFFSAQTTDHARIYFELGAESASVEVAALMLAQGASTSTASFES